MRIAYPKLIKQALLENYPQLIASVLNLYKAPPFSSSVCFKMPAGILNRAEFKNYFCCEKFLPGTPPVRQTVFDPDQELT